MATITTDTDRKLFRLLVSDLADCVKTMTELDCMRVDAMADTATIADAATHLVSYASAKRHKILRTFRGCEPILTRIAGLALSRAARCGSKRDLLIAADFYRAAVRGEGREDLILSARVRFNERQIRLAA